MRLPRAAAAVEYGAYVRQLSLLDDAAEAAHASASAEVVQAASALGLAGRSTRNSARSLFGDAAVPGLGRAYRRWLPHGPEEIDAARRTALSAPS